MAASLMGSAFAYSANRTRSLNETEHYVFNGYSSGVYVCTTSR